MYFKNKKNIKKEDIIPENKELEKNNIILKIIFNNIIEINDEKEVLKKIKRKSVSSIDLTSKFLGSILINSNKHSENIKDPFPKISNIIMGYNNISRKNLDKVNTNKHVISENFIRNGKKKSSSSKNKEPFSRNFILKSEIFGSNKGSLNKEGKEKLFTKMITHKNQLNNPFYNYYYNNSKIINKNAEKNTNKNNIYNKIINKNYIHLGLLDEKCPALSLKGIKYNFLKTKINEDTNVDILENLDNKITGKFEETSFGKSLENQNQFRNQENNINNNLNETKIMSNSKDINNYYTLKKQQNYNNNNINYSNEIKPKQINTLNTNYDYSSKQNPLYSLNNQNYISNFNTNLYSNINIHNYQWQNIYNTNTININNLNDDKQIIENVFALIKTQYGCYWLINKVIGDPKFANELLFPKLKDNLKELCLDYSRYSLIRILLSQLSYKNLDSFLFLIKDNLHKICLSEPGSRVIQKLIERLYEFPLLLNKFIYYFNNKDIGMLFFSPYSKYILMKLLSIDKQKEFSNFIYDYIFENFLIIAKEKHGVCVIQKSLSKANKNQRKKIYKKILENLYIIMKDLYGNYLIKFIFTKLEIKFDEILPIIIKIEQNIVDYCKCRYSSSVIEKSFERGDQMVSEHILKTLLTNYSNSIVDIITNPYGFYVIKKASYIKNKYLKELLMKIIVNNLDELKKKNYSNKIITCFSLEFKEFPDILLETNKIGTKIEK